MKTFYRRNLPHYQPGAGVYFITYRLCNSLPVNIFEQLQEEYLLYKKMLRRSMLPPDEVDRLLNIKYKKNFAVVDKYLNSGEYGEKWLSNAKVAEVNFQSLLSLNNASEKVICFCIMSNHVHLLLELSQSSIDKFEKLKEYETSRSKSAAALLSHLLGKLKGSTARASNLILNRCGSFWKHESYDHFVRNEKELLRIIAYILNNPVKAGLCKHWLDWKWTYLDPEYRTLFGSQSDF